MARAELEANLLSKRTKKGLESARSRGKLDDRKPMNEEKSYILKTYMRAKNI